MKLHVLKSFRGVLSGEMFWTPGMDIDVTDGVGEKLLATWPDRFELIVPVEEEQPRRRSKKA